MRPYEHIILHIINPSDKEDFGWGTKVPTLGLFILEGGRLPDHSWHVVWHEIKKQNNRADTLRHFEVLINSKMVF